MNFPDFVTSECSNTLDRHTSFLVDTQADISVNKLEALDENANIDTSEQITIRGITADPVDSIGIISLNIYFPENTISHVFHMVPNNFNTPSEVIGREFNRTYKCKID